MATEPKLVSESLIQVYTQQIEDVPLSGARKSEFDAPLQGQITFHLDSATEGETEKLEWQLDRSSYDSTKDPEVKLLADSFLSPAEITLHLDAPPIPENIIQELQLPKELIEYIKIKVSEKSDIYVILHGLENKPIPDINDFLKKIFKNQKMVSLQIKDIPLKESTVKLISEEIRYNQSLIALRLNYTNLTPGSMSILAPALSGNGSLRILDLENNPGLGSKGGILLTQYVYDKTSKSRLTTLVLSNTNLGNQGLFTLTSALKVYKDLRRRKKDIAKNKSASSLRALFLSNNNIRIPYEDDEGYVGYEKDKLSWALNDFFILNNLIKELHLDRNYLGKGFFRLIGGVCYHIFPRLIGKDSYYYTSTSDTDSANNGLETLALDDCDLQNDTVPDYAYIEKQNTLEYLFMSFAMRRHLEHVFLSGNDFSLYHFKAAANKFKFLFDCNRLKRKDYNNPKKRTWPNLKTLEFAEPKTSHSPDGIPFSLDGFLENNVGVSLQPTLDYIAKGKEVIFAERVTKAIERAMKQALDEREEMQNARSLSQRFQEAASKIARQASNKRAKDAVQNALTHAFKVGIGLQSIATKHPQPALMDVAMQSTVISTKLRSLNPTVRA